MNSEYKWQLARFLSTVPKPLASRLIWVVGKPIPLNGIDFETESIKPNLKDGSVGLLTNVVRKTKEYPWNTQILQVEPVELELQSKFSKDISNIEYNNYLKMSDEEMLRLDKSCGNSLN